MAGLIFGQFSMWAILIIGLAIVWGIAVWRNTDRALASWISAGFVVLVLCFYGFGIRFGINVDDFCVNNGHVTSAVYEEEWTEEYWETVETRDNKGNVTSSHLERRERTHSPSWKVYTTVGDAHVDFAAYRAIVSRFLNERMTSSHHPSQCSRGDGRTFQTDWRGGASTFIPWSVTMDTINWVKASKGTVEKRGGASGFTVPAYPDLVQGPHGPRQPRVLNVGLTGLDVKWQRAVEWDMDVLADAVGASKQCNPLIVVTTQGPGFTEALRAAWLNGKKNDVILVLGVSTWPKIEWADVIAWDKGSMLAPALRSEMPEISLDDRAALVRTFGGAIQKHFQRHRMHDFEYLKDGIEIPGWISVASIIALIAAGVGTFFAPSFWTPSYPTFPRSFRLGGPSFVNRRRW